MSGRFVGVGRHLFQHQVLARSFFLLPCQALTRNTIVQTHIRRSSTTAKSQSRQKKHASPIHHIPEVDPEAIITLKAPIKIHVDEKGVALSVMLMQTHIERNNNKFYLMQVLEDENNPYEVVLWSRWGRVGVRGQTYSITKSKDATIKLFKQKFETKTGNSWDDLNNFKACPDKYVVVELGSKNPFVPPKPTQTEQEIPESKLPNKVQKLLALIFSERMMVQQMTQMGLDSKKLPFGKLSTTTIQNGFQALNQIAAELDSANPSQTILSQLSGLFYSFIPHNLGFRRMSDFVISDKIKLQQKVDMLQSLGEMEVAAQMMREARDSDSNSNPVDVHHSQLGCSIAPIPKTSETFQLVEKYVQNTHGPTHNQYTLRVEGVFKLSRSTNTTNTTTDTTNATNTDSTDFSKTLLLPKTSLPMRADAHQREITLQKYIMTSLYDWQATSNSGPAWVLHDGPPYANGQLHMGHLLNKTLKDVVNRYKVMQGYRVHYVPGWDCHGLPIEMKALEQLKGDSRSSLKPLEIRELSRRVAVDAIEKQRSEFIRWGVMADWDTTYRTLDPVYEAHELRVFADLIEKGLVYQALKPVYWSPSSMTALAEAELEYPDNHTSTAVYVTFDIASLEDCQDREVLKAFSNLKAVIWTTTPWTLVANKAICVNPSIEYSVVEHSDAQLIVATALLESLARKLQKEELKVLHTFAGSRLAGAKFQHPFLNQTSVVLQGDHVTTESGTGLVHTAPGHGLEDFIVCRENSIDPYCPVNEKGVFTAEAGALFHGKAVLGEGNVCVLDALRKLHAIPESRVDEKQPEEGSSVAKKEGGLQSGGALLLAEKHSHRYPYDWRTKKPVIFRATKQWFINLQSIEQDVLNAIQDVQTVPDTGKSRLTAAVTTRSEWCISRQRSWGVPLPVFYHNTTGDALVSKEIVDHVADLVSRHERGCDCWWELPVEQLLPPKFAHLAQHYTKGLDTLDVWFDSGVSWRSVLADYNISRADLYLEGSDQHRGWFQSSLLTSVAVTGQAPYKTVLTHGFVLDDSGRKMSKSLGNVIVPSSIVEGDKAKGAPAYGVDVLRLWVAQSDSSKDVTIGREIIQTTSDNLRKIRNIARFLLGNLHDFDPSRDALPYDSLYQADKYLLHILVTTARDITSYYDSLSFHRVCKSMQGLVAEISALFFEISKDKLYADSPNSVKRRSCQTALHYALEVVTKSTAPLVPHTSQDVHSHNPWATATSVFHDAWISSHPEWENSQLFADWQPVLAVKAHVNSLIEHLRQNKVVRTSQEVKVSICVNTSPSSALAAETTTAAANSKRLFDYLTQLNESGELVDVLLVSACSVREVSGGVTETEGEGVVVHCGQDAVALRIAVGVSDKLKCPRCWRHTRTHATQTLCVRCANVLQN
eukprot:c12200_g1_i1.p1 GENE.c12200_g1_i1~~c12200_g1_i1.p1  ORF type:complete len:1388 (+),score=335.82 c12200_g1_i1:36-4199(+)